MYITFTAILKKGSRYTLFYRSHISSRSSSPLKIPRRRLSGPSVSYDAIRDTLAKYYFGGALPFLPPSRRA